MRKGKIIIFILVSLFAFSGCGSNKADDRTTMALNSGQLEANLDSPNIPFEMRKSISLVLRDGYIKKKYGNPDITRTCKDYSYEIRNMEDGSKLFVFYSDKKNVRNIWRLKKLMKRKDFDQIKPGVSSSVDIIKIDPYTVITGDEGISEHKLINNEVAVIKYLKKDNKWIVNDINYENDQSDFSAMLLPEDLEEIS
ncbi:MAG: hypothetical protein Q8920_11815 [Bacillota bacterium]|nr:hypothetical protein [Bacillota bacterium]